MTPTSERFEALDSWRGVCASLVAIFHFKCFGNLYDLAIVRNGTMYVDFFFVLSGFVITANYLLRLQDGFGTGRFMFLRAGRVWPLHIFMLLVFLAFEATFGGLVSSYSPTARQPFSGANSWEAFWANIVLIHSLNIFEHGTWNVPSWSISVEYYTYLAFAIVVLAAGRWIAVWSAILMIAFPIMFLSIDGLTMGAAHGWGILRSAYGFCAGGVAYMLYSRRIAPTQMIKRLGFAASTALEALAVVAVFALVSYGKHSWIWSFTPYVFGAVILVFAAEGGGVSRLMKTRPFLLLGALSYSIYMVHYFIQLRVINAAKLAEKLTGERLLTPHTTDEGVEIALLGIERWQGDLAYVAMMAIVIAASYATYTLIERPAQDVSRRWARRIWRDAPTRTRTV